MNSVQQTFRGRFWSASDENLVDVKSPRLPQSGELRIFANGRVELDIDFGFDLVFADLGARIRRIYGDADGKKFTLVGNHLIRDTLGFSDGGAERRQTYLIERCFIAESFLEDADYFDEVVVELPGLMEWIATSTIKYSAPEENSVLIFCRNPEPLVGRFEGAEVKIQFFGDGLFQPYGFEFRSKVCLRIKFVTKMSLQRIFELVYAAQSLISFALEDFRAPPESFVLYQSSDGTEGDKGIIELHREHIFQQNKPLDSVANPRISFSEIGGIEFMARWLEQAASKTMYLDQLHMGAEKELRFEIRFLTLAMLSQSIRAGLYEKKNLGIEDSLKEEFDELGGVGKIYFREDQRDKWAKDCRQLRNRIAHEIGSPLDMPSSDVYFFGEIIRFTLITYFLNYCGASVDAIHVFLCSYDVHQTFQKAIQVLDRGGLYPE